jgi:hypothetical protein
MKLGLEESRNGVTYRTASVETYLRGRGVSARMAGEDWVSAHRGQFDTITGSSIINGLPVPIKALTTRIYVISM